MPDLPARVGIVVRTKNRPWFLRRALDDIVAQGYPYWRVQIVNDGGDALAVDEVVAGLGAAHRDRVSVIHNQESRGRSSAANQGVTALGTEFVVLHDDDDLWHPAFLGRTVDHLDAHPTDTGVVVRTEIVYEEADGYGGFAEVGREVFWAGLSEITLTELLEINRWVPIAYLYRRRLHDAVGLYDESVDAAEDWEFNLRTLPEHRVGFIGDSTLAYWMQRRGLAGDLANSMFALAHDHDRFDRLIRDEALRAYVRANGAGLPLYIDKLIRETVKTEVAQQLARQLDARLTDGQRIMRRLRGLGRRRR